ncbi:hypothetical protein LNQ03_08420 [Klebsiella pneumoniae subsp. pneumoniae]|nr:hypothetical protein [Klebsiella pneumoniae subsp. pneumoniae]
MMPLGSKERADSDNDGTPLPVVAKARMNCWCGEGRGGGAVRTQPPRYDRRHAAVGDDRDCLAACRIQRFRRRSSAPPGRPGTEATRAGDYRSGRCSSVVS